MPDSPQSDHQTITGVHAGCSRPGLVVVVVVVVVGPGGGGVKVGVPSMTALPGSPAR